MTDKDKNQGEGNVEAARRFNKAEADFAQSGPVEEKAKEARDALDGPQADELEEARRSTGTKHP